MKAEPGATAAWPGVALPVAVVPIAWLGWPGDPVTVWTLPAKAVPAEATSKPSIVGMKGCFMAVLPKRFGRALGSWEHPAN